MILTSGSREVGKSGRWGVGKSGSRDAGSDELPAFVCTADQLSIDVQVRIPAASWIDAIWNSVHDVAEQNGKDHEEDERDGYDEHHSPNHSVDEAAMIGQSVVFFCHFARPFRFDAAVVRESSTCQRRIMRSHATRPTILRCSNGTFRGRCGNHWTLLSGASRPCASPIRAQFWSPSPSRSATWNSLTAEQQSLMRFPIGT